MITCGGSLPVYPYFFLNHLLTNFDEFSHYVFLSFNNFMNFYPLEVLACFSYQEIRSK